VIVGALAVLVVVLIALGIETNQRSLEDIAPETDALPLATGHEMPGKQHL
jgi:putative MFS transporter